MNNEFKKAKNEVINFFKNDTNFMVALDTAGVDFAEKMTGSLGSNSYYVHFVKTADDGVRTVLATLRVSDHNLTENWQWRKSEFEVILKASCDLSKNERYQKWYADYGVMQADYNATVSTPKSELTNKGQLLALKAKAMQELSAKMTAYKNAMSTITVDYDYLNEVKLNVIDLVTK